MQCQGTKDGTQLSSTAETSDAMASTYAASLQVRVLVFRRDALAAPTSRSLMRDPDPDP